MPSIFLKTSGVPIICQSKIGMGGEGEVWQTQHPHKVVKLFFHPDEKKAKLIAMVKNPPQQPKFFGMKHTAITWPEDLVVNEQGQFIGYYMERVSGALTLNHIYHPRLRKKYTEGFNWYYLHMAACNLASIVHSLHVKNYIVGDLRPENFLVTERSLMSVIDVDSFQFKEGTTFFPCSVGAEGFTAPEFIGHTLESVERTLESDYFALAVLIFMLLYGWHPFSGQQLEGDMSRDEAVQKHWWIGNASSPLYVSPIQSASVKNQMPEELYAFFVRAFEQPPTLRPTALEWKTLLESLLERLQICSTQSQHHYYKRPDQSGCFWCAHYEDTGQEYFPPLATEKNYAHIFKHFQDALATGDIRRQVMLWQQHTFLHTRPEFFKLNTILEQRKKTLEELEQFLQRLQTTQNIETLLRLWEKNQDLFDGMNLEQISFQEGTLKNYIDAMRRQYTLQQKLQESIHYAEDMFQRQELIPDYEQQIIDLYEVYHQGQQKLLPNYLEAKPERVIGAEQRLKSWRTFQNLLQDPSTGEFYFYWDKNYKILKGFYRNHHQRKILADVDKAWKEFERLKRIIKEHPYDDDLLLEKFKRCRFIQESFFLHHTVLKNQTLQQKIEHAQQRWQSLQDLEEKYRKGHYADILKNAESIFLKKHPQADLWRERLSSLKKSYKDWLKIKRALLEHENSYVFTHWKDSLYADFAIKEGMNQKVQALYKTLYVHWNTSPQIIFYPVQNYMFLYFVWPFYSQTPEYGDDIIPAEVCFISVYTKEKFLYKTWMLYEDYKKHKFFVFPYVCSFEALFVDMQPALWVNGAPLSIGSSKRLSYRPEVPVYYKVSPKKILGGSKEVIITYTSPMDCVSGSHTLFIHSEHFPLPSAFAQSYTLPALTLKAGQTVRRTIHLTHPLQRKMFLRILNKEQDGIHWLKKVPFLHSMDTFRGYHAPISS